MAKKLAVTKRKVQIIRKLDTTGMGATEQTLVKKGKKYFVVSSASVPYSGLGFETLVFPADKKGNVTDWLDVVGGPGMSQEEAIEDLENRQESPNVRSVLHGNAKL